MTDNDGMQSNLLQFERTLATRHIHALQLCGVMSKVRFEVCQNRVDPKRRLFESRNAYIWIPDADHAAYKKAVKSRYCKSMATLLVRRWPVQPLVKWRS